MAYQQIVRTRFKGETKNSLGNVPDAYCQNFDTQVLKDDHARPKVLGFEKRLAATVEAAKDVVIDTKLKDLKPGQSMVWGGCLITLGEDGKYYMSGFDLSGGNIPEPTGDEAVVKDCKVFEKRRNTATSVRILQEFEDGFVLSYYDVTVPFQSYKLFEVEPKVGDGLGHPKYGHSHALRFIMSNRREHTFELNGEMMTVVCQEVKPGLYVLPHVLVLEDKYRVAFNPENVAKDYDDSVKVEVIGFSLNWSVFWAHCHIAILMKVEDDMMEPEPEPEPESMCSMMAGALCRGTSVASSDDGLDAPLTRQMTKA
jgi:hypothetical protein